MKIQIEERHLNTLLRHGETVLLQAHLLTQNPLFAPGAQSFVEELTDAIASARKALTEVDSHRAFIVQPNGDRIELEPRS